LFVKVVSPRVEDFESTYSATKAERRRFHNGAAHISGIAYAG